jgi:hypothetical protein
MRNSQEASRQVEMRNYSRQWDRFANLDHIADAEEDRDDLDCCGKLGALLLRASTAERIDAIGRISDHVLDLSMK